MRNYFQIFEKAIAYQNKQRKENGEPTENICYFVVGFSEGVFARKIKKGFFEIGAMVPGKSNEVKTKNYLLSDLDPFERYCICHIIDESLIHDKELATAVYDY